MWGRAGLRARQLAVPFWSWHEGLRERRRQKGVAARVVLRMRRQAVAAALDAWREKAQVRSEVVSS